jgi:hypothetical protein
MMNPMLWLYRWRHLTKLPELLHPLWGRCKMGFCALASFAISLLKNHSAMPLVISVTTLSALFVLLGGRRYVKSYRTPEKGSMVAVH